MILIFQKVLPKHLAFVILSNLHLCAAPFETANTHFLPELSSKNHLDSEFSQVCCSKAQRAAVGISFIIRITFY
jgi:hypothetical protein